MPHLAGLGRYTEEQIIQARAMVALADNFKLFFKQFPPKQPYVYGRHTMGMIAELQLAMERYRGGESTHLAVCVPFRHGKSDVLSRRYACWHLLNYPDEEIIQAAYDFDLAKGFSREVRGLFQKIGPMYNLDIDKNANEVAEWHIKDRHGIYHAVGLTGGITGRGASVLLVDDYMKSRATAESETMRRLTWEAFGSDLMTRLTPSKRIVAITANRWHQDDLVGRIINKNNAEHEDYDPLFPVFRIVKFPAQSEDWKTERNGDGWLFPERFEAEWYESQRATIGKYAWSAQAMQDPTPRGGNMLRVDLVRREETMPEGVEWVRGWDLASTGKDRAKEDPDWTVGTLAGVKNGTVYVRDVVRGRWSAGERNRVIVATALKDGPAVRIHVEGSGPYLDAYNQIREELMGRSVVRRICPNKDKVTRAMALEPKFEAGLVVIRRAPWNEAWEDVLAAFPNGTHDDDVDSLVAATEDALTKRLGAQIFPMAMDDVHFAERNVFLEKKPGNTTWWVDLGNGVRKSAMLFLGIFHSGANRSGAVWCARFVEGGHVLVYRTYLPEGTWKAASDHAKAIKEMSGLETYARITVHMPAMETGRDFDVLNREDALTMYRYEDGNRGRPLITGAGRCKPGVNVDDVGSNWIKAALHASLAVKAPASAYWLDHGFAKGDVSDYANRRMLILSPCASELMREIRDARWAPTADGAMNARESEVESDNSLRRALYGLAASGM